MRFLIWKWRKHPIKRDERKRSLREQSFALFDQKLRPSEIHRKGLVAASLKTLFRYYEDWKKKGGHISYGFARRVLKENPDFNEELIKGLAKKLKMPVEEVIKRMQKPWGLKQALRGEFPDYGLEREQSDVEARLRGGLRFMRIAERFQHSPEELAEILLQITILKENVKLELTNKDGQLILEKQENGKVTTFNLDYGHKNDQ